MAKVQTIKFRDFMDGTWKEPKKKKLSKEEVAALVDGLVKAGTLIPLAIAPMASFASASGATETASKVVAGTALQILSHALDPIVQILVAISLPVASIVMIGGCFFFMFGNSEKAWSTIQNAGLGYVLIQLSPLFIKVLEQIGKSI